MKLTPLPRTDLKLLRDERPRSPGLHVTTVTNALVKAIDPELLAGETNALERGFLWEDVFTYYLGKRLQPTGIVERLCDQSEQTYTIAGQPLYATVDGLGQTRVGFDNAAGTDVPVGTPCVMETKMTAKSMRDFDLDARKFLPWRLQTMAYCHLTGFTALYLAVLWVNGNYGTERLPVFAEYWVEYTREELDQNWRAMVKMVERGDVQPEGAA